MGCVASKGRRQARSVGLSFALVSFVFFAVDLAIMFFSAMACEAKRRPYVWLSKGFGCLLRGANLGFIITWIVAAGQDMLKRMVFCTTAIATRVLGMCLYAVIYAVQDIVKPESTADLVQAITLHWEELPSRAAIPVTLIAAGLEAFFLCSLVRCQGTFALRSSSQEAAAASPGSSAEAHPPAALPAGGDATRSSDSSASGDDGRK